jgi:hypothetical protein
MKMKLADNPSKVIDEVITEVRAIKRSISERHDNDIDRLLDALMIQERSTGIGQAEQAGTGQPAKHPESEGSDKP